jgi:hypothetical protein
MSPDALMDAHKLQEVSISVQFVKGMKNPSRSIYKKYVT